MLAWPHTQRLPLASRAPFVQGIDVSVTVSAAGGDTAPSSALTGGSAAFTAPSQRLHGTALGPCMMPASCFGFSISLPAGGVSVAASRTNPRPEPPGQAQQQLRCGSVDGSELQGDDDNSDDGGPASGSGQGAGAAAGLLPEVAHAATPPASPRGHDSSSQHPQPSSQHYTVDFVLRAAYEVRVGGWAGGCVHATCP